MRISKKYLKQKFLPLLIASLIVVLLNILDVGDFLRSMKGYYLIMIIIGAGIYFSFYYLFALKCSECRFPTDLGDNFCRNCGQDLKQKKPVKKYTILLEDINKKFNKLRKPNSHTDQLQ
jgi:hypothetical protein